MNYKKLTTVIGIALFVFSISLKTLNAQQTVQVTEDRFIAYSLYNFSKLIDWPTSASATSFHIAVVGDKVVYQELISLARGKKVGKAVYKISYFKNVNEIAGNNQIIYLSNMHSSKVKNLATDPNFTGILLVTERQGMTSQGSAISFLVDDRGMMGFEIKRENAEKNNLSIRAQLERLASSVI